MMSVPHNRSNYWRLICIVTVTSCLVFPVHGQGFHASNTGRYAGGNRSEKPGFCPAVILMTSQKCPDACGGDNDCWGMKKCCRNGCGKRCTEPEVRNSVSPVTFGQMIKHVPEPFSGVPATQHNTQRIQGGGSNTPSSVRAHPQNTNHVGGSNNPTVPSSSLNSGVGPTPGTLHGAQTPHGSPMGGAQTPHGSPMGGPQTQHGSPMGGAHIQHGSPIGGPQTQHGNPMGGAQTQHGSPMGVAQTPHRSPMGGAQTQHGSPIGGAQTQHGNPMGGAQAQQSGSHNPPYVNADPTGNTQNEPSHNTQQQFYFPAAGPGNLPPPQHASPAAGPESPPPPQHASSSSQHGLHNSQHNVPSSQHGLSNSQNSAPSSQYGLPNSQHNTPPSQNGLPNSQNSAPYSQHGLHNSQHNAPPSQHELPNSQNSAPSSQHGLPNSQNSAPYSQHGLPNSQHNAPPSQNRLHNSQNSAPSSQHELPNSQNSAPSSQHGPPNSQHNAPPSQNGLHSSQNSAPSNQHGLPNSQNSAPTSQHNVPPSQHNVPPNQQGLPPSQHNAPAGQHNAPAGQHGSPPGHQEVPNSQHGTPNNQHSVPYSQQDVPYSPPRAANSQHASLPSGPYNSYPDIQSGYNQHDTPMLDSNSNYANPTGGQYNSPSNSASGQYNSPSNPAGGQYNSAPNPAQRNHIPPAQPTGGYLQFDNPQETVGVLNNQTYHQAFEPIQNSRFNAGSQQEYGPPLTSQGPPIPFSSSSRGGSEYHNIPRGVPRDTSNSRQGNIQPGLPNSQSSHSIGGSNHNNPLRGYRNQGDPADSHSQAGVGGSNTQYDSGISSNTPYNNPAHTPPLHPNSHQQNEPSGGSNSGFINTPQLVGGSNNRFSNTPQPVGGLNFRRTGGGSGVGNLRTIPLYQTTPIYDVRDGVCPRLFSRGVCQDECQSDSQCPRNRKCCSNGCGRVCLEPQNKDANTDPIVPKTIQKTSKHGSHGPSNAAFDGEANNLVDPSSLNILEIRPYSVGHSHSAVQILPYEYKTGIYDYHLENTVLNENVGENHHASDPYSYKQEPANVEPENKITQVVNPVIGRHINSKLHAKSMFSGSAVKLRPSMFGSVKIVPLDMKKFRKPKSGVNKKSMGVAELENPHNVKPHTEIPVVKAHRPNANKFVPGIPSETSLVEREPEIYSQTSNHNTPHKVNTVQQTQGKRNIRIDHGGTHISPSTGKELQGTGSRRGPHSSAGRSPATMYKSALKEGQGPQSRVRKPNNVHGRHNQNHAPETVPQENKGREPQRSQPSSASVGNQRPGGKGSLKPSRLVEGAQTRQQEAGSPRESRTSVNFGNLRSSARYGVESSPPRHGKQMNVMQFSAQGKTSAGPLAPVTVAVTRAPIIDPAVHNKGEANPKLLNKISETKIAVKTRKKSDMNVHPINSINYKNNGYSKNFFNPVYDQPAPQEIDPPTHFGDGMIRAMPRRGNSFSLMGGGKEAGTSMYDGSTSLQYNAANLGISDYGHPQTSAFEAQPIRRQRMRQRPARTGLSISKIYHDVGHGRAIMEPPNPYEFSSEFRRPSTKRPKPTYRPPVDSLGQVYIDIARFAENSLMAAPNPLKLRSGVRGHIPDIKTTAPPTSFSTPKETPISFIEKKTTDTINKSEVPKPDVKKKDARPKQYIPAGMALAKGSSDYPTNLKTKSSQSAPRLGISSTLVGAPAPAMKVETKIFNRAGFNLFTGYKPQYKVPVKEIRNPSIKGVPVFSARTKTTG